MQVFAVIENVECEGMDPMVCSLWTTEEGAQRELIRRTSTHRDYMLPIRLSITPITLDTPSDSHIS